MLPPDPHWELARAWSRRGVCERLRPCDAKARTGHTVTDFVTGDGGCQSASNVVLL